MTKDEFFPLVKELGFDIGERAIKIDDRVAMKIIAAIKERRRAGTKKSIFGDQATQQAEVKVNTSERILSIPDKITVKQFADKLNKRVADVIAVLMRNGFMATINETLDFETAAIIAEDMGYKPQLSLEGSEVDNADNRSEEIAKIVEAQDKSELQARAPVVVIMGHVDHGKTTLLDTIRKANVVAKEAGGITQHIGAYQVEKKGKLITFIDTPGHEAFTTMRSRGARVADVAILVVAADDSIKPQTLEAIQIMQESELPFIVAINKIDKAEADIEKVKRELSELNLVPEDWGGKTICVPISAKANKNIDELLETLLLVAELDKDKIVANPKTTAAGSIIESHVDKHAGPVATVLVQNGTLRLGDIVLIGNIPGRVRSMKNWNGEMVKTAIPSMPVQVLGLKKAPIVGDILKVVTDKKVLKQHVKSFDTFSFLQRTKQKEEEKDGKKKLALIVRADKLGSLEAIIQSLQSIKHEEVAIDVMKKGLGSVTESDVQIAKSSGAQILGFSVVATAGAEKYARDEHVDIHVFQIIYQLIDHTKTELGKLLSAEVTYNKIGTLRVLAIFKAGTHSTILGGRVEDGALKAQAPVKIIRSGKMVGEGIIAQLQKNKKNTSEVTSGTECGLRIEGDTPVEDGDTIECYEAEEKQRTLGV